MVCSRTLSHFSPRCVAGLLPASRSGVQQDALPRLALLCATLPRLALLSAIFLCLALVCDTLPASRAGVRHSSRVSLWCSTLSRISPSCAAGLPPGSHTGVQQDSLPDLTLVCSRTPSRISHWCAAGLPPGSRTGVQQDSIPHLVLVCSRTRSLVSL